jgi:type I restriction enzyme S subunit
MKPYPSYKDSGVEWIGRIPNGWTIQKLKYFSCVNLSNVDKKSQDGQPKVRLCNYTDVYYNEFITSDLNFMEATASPEQIEKFTLKKGDVLITKDSEEWDDIAVPAYVAMNYEDVLCGYHLAHIRPCEEFIDGRYLMRSFNAYPLYVQFKVSANGITRYGIGKYDIENALFILPTTNEQKAISVFLDKKTSLIDGLIEKKKRQIELLKEQRQAMINQAVTKGINPNVEMKDSGVEWIGKIPKHWKVKPLKHVGTNGLTNGIFKKKDQYGSGTRLVNVIDLYQEDLLIREDSLGRVETDDNETLKYKVINGDIFFVRSSLKLEGIGVSALIGDTSEPTVFECHIVRFRPSPNAVNSTFLINYLNSWYIHQRLISISQTVTMSTISQDKIASLEIALPPLKEQSEVAEYINASRKKIEVSISKAEKQIELLHEYRTALISEAVTGKIDVREAV